MKKLASLLILSLALAAPGFPAAAETVVVPRPDAGADSTDMPQRNVGAPDKPAADAMEKGDRKDRETASAAARKAERIDALFGRLANARNDRQAKRIARHIMRRMAQSGSDTVDLLMRQAAVSMKAKDYAKALDILDGVIRLHPDYVEGWNRRATVYFLAEKYGESLADIEQVLRREPRHWGALAGMSMILLALDREEDAVAVMDRALEIHPHLEDMKKRRDRIALELSGAEI
ncbi:tetratricopeptide repeat protein [Acuticoccus sp. MNP-M23]|uniref:tetratricopeptide repeat protein n=1 Tax=Acuticoccus sp. MNP-M23 TaxID=3072793 RepID=UPI002815F01D|nr:tetratricopeptide repeat protein [Acuticoccus sp. MNP-M23]WMS44222.1 tetratricopeptide repeat protein [Acuticoccus sp. MNP-M23]